MFLSSLFLSIKVDLNNVVYHMYCIPILPMKNGLTYVFSNFPVRYSHKCDILCNTKLF